MGLWQLRTAWRAPTGVNTQELAYAQVCKDQSLADWQLYLVDWGYNTEAERQHASENKRISVITHSQFAQLLETGAA